MKQRSKTAFVLIALVTLASAPAGASQEAASRYLGNGFAYDGDASAANADVVTLIQGTLFGMMPGFEVGVEVHRFDGSLDDAIAALNLPSNTLVEPPSRTPAGAALGMLLGLVGEEAQQQLGQEHYERLRAAAVQHGSTEAATYQATIGMDGLTGGEEPTPGSLVSLTSLSLSNPFLDFGTGELREGTWLVVAETSFRVPTRAEMEAMGLAGEDPSDWADDEWDTGGADTAEIGVTMFPGARPLDPNETSYSSMLFGRSFLVERPAAEVVEFFLASEERHCRTEDEWDMETDTRSYRFVDVYCLTHEGDYGPGDQIIAIQISEAMRELVGEVMDRNIGDWTLINIDSWVEEQ